MKHLASEGTRSLECWGVDDPFPCRDCIQKRYTMIRITDEEAQVLAKQVKEDYEHALHSARAEAEHLNEISRLKAHKPIEQTSPSVIPVSVVILWAIAAFSLGFTFCGLLMGCGGSQSPIHYCCYGGKEPSCVDAYPGCTFHAEDADAGDAQCGTMTCD